MLLCVFMAQPDALLLKLRHAILTILASLGKYLQKAFLAYFCPDGQIIKIHELALQKRD